MRRRTFIKAAPLALLALALPKFVAAQGLSKKTTTALKGFVANEPTAQLVNPLAPDWIYTQFGPWLLDIEYAPGIKAAYHHFENIPTVAAVQAMMQCSHYDHWHILGRNEADYNRTTRGLEAFAVAAPSQTPEDYAAFVMTQSEPILAADPNALFCLQGGMQGNPMYEPNSWFDRMWAQLPRPGFRNRVRALVTNYYVQQQYPNNPEKWFLPYPVGKYLKRCRESLDAKNLSLRQLWGGEIGLALDGPVTLTSADAANYVRTCHEQYSQFANRWSWYAQLGNGNPASHYLPLTSYAAGPSSAGLVFASL